MINHAGWQVQGVVIDPVLVLLALAGVLVMALIALIVVIWRNGSRRTRAEVAQLDAARLFETEVAALKGRLQTMAELSVTRQSELSRTIHERLDRIGHNVGVNLEETTRKTTENLSKLHERLAVIDNAQRNITELSTRVVSLQDILANKQQRGAFGQLRMETIVQDGLPKESYTFQATLSNGKRPDCLVHLPGSAAGIIIDAKFPLEGFEVLRAAHEEAIRREALRRIRIDVGKHVDDIASKYALPGETQDTMLMFVPSRVDLCRTPRELPRSAAEGAPRPRRDRVSEYADAGRADHASHHERRKNARASRPHPTRGRDAHAGRQPPPRTGAGPSAPFRHGERRRGEDPDVDRQDREPWPENRESRY